MKKALVTGVNGQDGSYLTELLLEKGYEVHGIIRRASSINWRRIEHLTSNPAINNKTLFLHYGDMTDGTNITNIVCRVKPEETYNLAAQSHVSVSFDVPEYTANTDGIGCVRLLEAIKHNCPDCRYYQASTSEMYGAVTEVPQNENTSFRPQSPYAAAKLFAFWTTRCYRDAYGLFASNGILMNHESERRSYNFVSRKITLSVAKIKAGIQDFIALGNLKAKRDWGYAPEYVKGMYLILQHDTPDDFVLATGEMHTVEDFCDLSFNIAGIPLTWEGEDLNRVGIDKNGNIRVKVDSSYFRPLDVNLLLGDATKAKNVLGWTPTIKFEKLVELMTLYDLSRIK